MACTPETVLSFVQKAKKKREAWFQTAKTSWGEIKRRNKNNRLWSITPNSSTKSQRYPAWWSIYKIRQPLVLSRAGVPVGRDTSPSGDDQVGRVAAMCRERLAVALAKNFDFFEVLTSARDDFLITDFGQVRAYYERDTVSEKVKIPLTVSRNEMGEPVFLDPRGQVVESDEIMADTGNTTFWMESEEVVDVDNERICLEPVIWKHFYADPDAYRWQRVRRVAFEEILSPPQFKERFGQAVYNRLIRVPEYAKFKEESDGIVVYEYWDSYEKKAYWVAEDFREFLRPVDMPEDAEEYYEDRKGLYGLDGFFPCPKPLMINQATDEFWPTPEFEQLQDWFEDIHNIFTRMVTLTRAMRPRLLFDNSIQGLQEALQETRTADAIGVPNLSQSLVSNGGTLANAMQYVPVAELIEGLNNLYVALENRLNQVYKLTGTSDLLQGLITDQTDRTLGERQMTEKYALNQLEERQRKMQEFVRDCYELITEMALKNFKDQTLERYIQPSTLPPDDAPFYYQAIELLESDLSRFRVELETDSTIAMNEEYDKQMRIELVNAMTAALEKTVQMITTTPELAKLELHSLKFLIQGFRHGKLFQTEIISAIEALIEKLNTPQEPAQPDIEQQKLQLSAQKIQAEIELAVRKQLAQENKDIATLQLENQKVFAKAQADGANAQLAGQRLAVESQLTMQQMVQESLKLREELAIKREALQIEAAKVGNDAGIKQLIADIDAQIAAADLSLRKREIELKEMTTASSEQEKWATEQRLAAAHELDSLRAAMEMAKNALEAKNLGRPQEAAPKVTINLTPGATGGF